MLACGRFAAQPAQVEASFSTLLDDEDEFEFEEGDEAEFVEDDVDPTLLVDNLGLSEEVSRLQYLVVVTDLPDLPDHVC